MSTQTFDGSYQFYVTLLKIVDYKIVIEVSGGIGKDPDGGVKLGIRQCFAMPRSY